MYIAINCQCLPHFDLCHLILGLKVVHDLFKTPDSIITQSHQDKEQYEAQDTCWCLMGWR